MNSYVQKNLKKNDESHITQYLAAVTASLTFLNFGIYQGWPGPALVKILSDEYPISVDQEEASIVATIGTVGHVIGGFTASYLADHIGRKTTIMGIGLPQILWPMLIYWSYYSKYLLYIARIVGGIGEGASVAVVGTYIAETVVPTVRGVLGGFTTVCVGLGVFIINIAGSFLTLKESAIVMSVFPVIFWISFMFMPESPYYYLIRNKPEKAKDSLKILRRKYDVEKEFAQLTIDVQNQMSERGSFKDLFFIPINRKVLIFVTLLRLFQMFTGYSAFVSYSQLMIVQTTNLSPVLGSSLISLGGILAMIIASTFIDKIGRRTLFLSSIVLCFTALISMALFLSLRDYTLIDLSSVSFMPLVFIIFYNIVFCGGLGLAVNIYIAEIYSANIRAKGLSIGSITFAVAIINTTKLYQYTADYVGASVPFYLFSVVSVFGFIFIYFYLPETKGKTLGVIQDELRGKRNKSIISLSNFKQ